jgi:hypothetical protein
MNGMFLAVLMFAIIGSQPGAVDADDGATDLKKVVDKARKLDWEGLSKYVEELGKNKNIAALTAIADSKDILCGGIAVTEIVRLMETDKAILYCAGLEIGSLKWGEALYGLRHHPKNRIIGYFKQSCTSQIVEARYYCYRLGIAEDWDDFTVWAKKDLGCKEKVSSPGASSYETLGDVAKWYLERVNPK